jgi:hypothetical protein
MSRVERPVDLVVDVLELDGVALDGHPDDFSSLVCDALAQLVAERGLPPAGATWRDEPAAAERSGDAELAERVALGVWQQLAVAYPEGAR